MLYKLTDMFKTYFAFHCRYITELLGGEQYVSCSVVLPAYRHLVKVMEPSDNDPIYFVRFKKVFTTDLTQRKNSTNLTWLKIATALDPRFKDLKCLPKEERSEVWDSVRGQVTRQPPAVTTEEPSPKKRKMSIFLLGSSDTSDEEEESIEHCLDRYKAEPKTNMEGCPLQWWSQREEAHTKLGLIASTCQPLQPQCLERGCSRSLATSIKRSNLFLNICIHRREIVFKDERKLLK